MIKENKKRLINYAVFIFVILFFIQFVTPYTQSFYSSTNNNAMGILTSSGGQSLRAYEDLCQQGNDFIIQITPLSCTPTLVRSDLLEEENVNVYCKMTGIQMNPLIDVTAIDSISFDKEYPRDVLGIGYMPAQSALGYNLNSLDGSLSLNNLGYVVITLRRQPNESALTNCEKQILGSEVCWIRGNLTATLRYDVQNSFGVGNGVFYLPVMEDEEWEENYIRYGFWDGRGYLRAQDVEDDKATLAIYSDNHITSSIISGTRTYSLAKYASNIPLDVGSTSNKIFLPGLSPCLGSLQLQLIGVEDPDTVARIRVNDEYMELKDEEKFLDEKCTVKNIISNGINQEVEIKCKEDNGLQTYSLRISPSVDLEIDGKKDSYEVGKFLYQSSDGKKSVYLGYIGSYMDSSAASDKDDIYIYLVALAGEPKKRLTDSELKLISTYANKIVANIGSNRGKDDFSSKYNAVIEKIFVEVPFTIGAEVITGQEFKKIDYQHRETGIVGLNQDFQGKSIAFLDFSLGDDVDISEIDEQYSQYYEYAMDDFDKDVDTYTNEVEEVNSIKTWGERALIEEIKLSRDVGQKAKMLELCRLFIQSYPNSIESLELCTNAVKISNSENSVKDATINGRVERISFEGVSEPGINQYSATVLVQGPNKTNTFYLTKNRQITLGGFRNQDNLADITEYLTLQDLDTNAAKIQLVVDNINDKGEPLSDIKTFSLNNPQTYGVYTFTVTDIQLEKVAKVKVIANTDLARSNSSFTFNIGVEKRAIQLSPEKAEQRIKEINESIENYKKVSNYLNGVVKAMRGACIATESYLTIKNIIANRDGKSIARQEVMTGTGGWNDKCRALMKQYPTKYKSLNDCFLDNAGKIEKDVNTMTSAIKTQNTILKDFDSRNLEGANLVKAYSEKVSTTLNSLPEGQLSEEELTKIKESLSLSSKDIEGLLNKNALTLEDIKEIHLYSLYLTNSSISQELKETAVERLNAAVTEVTVNTESYLETQKIASSLGITLSDIDYVSLNKETKELIYSGTIAKQYSSILPDSIPDSTPAVFVKTDVGDYNYIFVLENTPGSNIYQIMQKELSVFLTPSGQSMSIGKKYLIYDTKGNLVTDTNIIDKLKNLVWVKSTNTNNNPYKSSYGSTEILVKYYETYPYKGKPEIVPVDLKRGFYAGISSPSTSYEDSGRVTQFYICNVGSDGIESFEVTSPMFGGDNCHLVILSQSSTYSKLFGLKPEEITKLVDDSRSAIEQAQRAYKEGVTTVSVEGNKIKVGEPAGQAILEQCTDTMSVKDCTTLFNVCDPVVCPSSRCNLGGKYYVKDVIQSGIVGSIALCYPNAKWEGGDVYVPFCLSGVNAGLEAWISVKQAHADCLQKYLDSGETVGICDEQNSIYICEFFWKQSIPIIKMISKKIINKVTGEDGRGGGEYQTFSAALKNAKDSIDYFTNYYAENSYRIFQTRSTEEIGTSICGSFASVIYPDQGNFFNNLLTPDSPAQYVGKFEEIQLTTATNPPTSQYNVWYHIYAGTDYGVHYTIYLRGSGSSYYQDTAQPRSVKSGYIEKGGYADEKIEFTAPSGYSKLCIVVNGQEECGFKEVSSSFAVNYLSDLYVKDQAEDSDIKTEKECISGTASIYSLLDLNIEDIADNELNAELFSQGITRTCDTQNPGVGVDATRWKQVGICGDKAIGCWIDTQSVKDAIKALNLEDKALDKIDANTQEYLSGDYETVEEFEARKKTIQAANRGMERINIINLIFGESTIFINNQKAYLHFWRGDSYGYLARDSYEDFKTKESTETQSDAERQKKIDEFFKTYTSPTFEFQDSRITENVLYQYFDSEWHWTTKASATPYAYATPYGQVYASKSGWVKTTDYKDGGSRSPDEESLTYIKKLQGKSYLEGLEVLIERTISYKKLGGAIRGDLYTYSSGYTSMSHEAIFSVKTDDKSYYKYTSDGWKWSLDENKWESVATKTINGESAKGDVLNYLTALDNALTIYEGAAILFENEPITLINTFDRGGTTGVACSMPAVRCVGVTYWECHDGEWIEIGIDYEKCQGGEPSTEEIFMIKKNLDFNSYTTYFKYDNGWQWSVDIPTSTNRVWTSVSEKVVTGGLNDGYTPTTTKIINMLEMLETKDYLRGKEALKGEDGIMQNGNDIVLLSAEEIAADTTTTSNEIFVINQNIFQDLSVNKIYFKYNNGWQWSADYSNRFWTPVTTTTAKGGNYVGHIPSTKVSTIIESLQGKKFLQGKEILRYNDGTMENGDPISLFTDCKPETSAAFCIRMSKECGKVTGTDKNCNLPITVPSCGTCPTGKVCFEGKCVIGGGTTTPTNFEESLQRRDLTKLTNLMKSLSTTCSCGSNCEDYAQWIAEACQVEYVSGKPSVPDELLLLAIMIQESSCKSVSSSDGNDNGLMQINILHCGTKGLPSDTSSCKSTLLNNPETNIKTAAQILREAYSTSSRAYTCGTIPHTYTKWEYALRGYNGWACTGDDNYVENIKTKYFELVQLYNGNYNSGSSSSSSSSSSTSGSTTGTTSSSSTGSSTTTTSGTDLSSFSSAEQKVITNADECADCGGAVIDFNLCDKAECDAIAKKLGRECVYVFSSRDCNEKATCTPESNSAFCKRLGKNCGSVTAKDNCGLTRTVSSCGTCTTTGQTCGGGGTANVCGCTVTTYTPALSTFCGARTVTTNCGTNIGKSGTLQCISPQTCDTQTGKCVTSSSGTTNPCPTGTTYLGKQDGYSGGKLTKVDICSAGKIKVNAEIAEGVLKLINDAKSEKNIDFSKNAIGFRTLDEQISEYEENCNDELISLCSFTINTFPSPQDSITDYYNTCHIGNNIKGTCSPSTASPGYSNHQMGLAIDFECWINGIKQAPFANSDCYDWLIKNSEEYGLKRYYISNQEFWHWSIDGH